METGREALSWSGGARLGFLFPKESKGEREKKSKKSNLTRITPSY